ncbi:DUF3644 domain-containing protein [Amycolatopsis japonica]
MVPVINHSMIDSSRSRTSGPTPRQEVLLAVRLYNDPSELRYFEGFVVHMHLAWLYLPHVELTRDSIDFRHWRTRGRTRRLEQVDDEPKRSDLATYVRHRRGRGLATEGDGRRTGGRQVRGPSGGDAGGRAV